MVVCFLGAGVLLKGIVSKGERTSPLCVERFDEGGRVLQEEGVKGKERSDVGGRKMRLKLEGRLSIIAMGTGIELHLHVLLSLSSEHRITVSGVELVVDEVGNVVDVLIGHELCKLFDNRVIASLLRLSPISQYHHHQRRRKRP